MPEHYPCSWSMRTTPLSIRAETLPGFDTHDPGQTRRQTRLRKRGDTWEPTEVNRVSLIPHGHPELLTTGEGVILHISPPGISECVSKLALPWWRERPACGFWGNPNDRKRDARATMQFQNTLSWTTDAGAHWTDFALSPPAEDERWKLPGAAYYPRSVQMANGEILCVGHFSGDDPYGVVDQAIAALRFSIERTE